MIKVTILINQIFSKELCVKSIIIFKLEIIGLGNQMEIVVDKEYKIVELWLTNEESSNPATNTFIDNICAEYSKNKYKVVIFRSGTGNLKSLTETLLRNNMLKFAEKEST